MPVPTIDAKLLDTKDARVVRNSLCVVPGAIGGKIVAQSPYYGDQGGGKYSKVTFYHAGSVRIDVSISLNNQDPKNQAAIDAAKAAGTEPPKMDLDDIEWWPVGEHKAKHGPSIQSAQLTGEGGLARYVRWEVLTGTLTKIEAQ